MTKNTLLYIITLILAFCSIVYELILAQSLSAFLENTVLRYSVTIGLYMCSLGFGALFDDWRVIKSAVVNLLRIEIVLTFLGGAAVVLLHILDYFHLPRWLFSGLAHSLIILIGFLSGFEIPLLMAMAKKKGGGEDNFVLAFNYFGAFWGTVCFAFVFYPVMGLVATAFFVGGLNALSGLGLYLFAADVEESQQKSFYLNLYIQLALFFIIGLCLIFSESISQYLLDLYLGSS